MARYLNSRSEDSGTLRRFRAPLVWTSTVATVALIAFLCVLSSAGTALGASFVSLRGPATTSEASAEPGASGSTTAVAVLSSCTVGAAWSDAYDPADGYVYVANFVNGTISIVKPPCTVVETLASGAISTPYGTIYDPQTKEVVVTSPGAGLAYVLQGTSVVKKVGLGGSGHCPTLGDWDSGLGAMLIADECSPGHSGGGGIDVLHLTLVAGVTHASVVLDAFDRTNAPNAVLAADGYIFSAGLTVDVFRGSTFAFVGKYAVHGSSDNSLAWDPLNGTVVLGKGDESIGYDSVIFLDTARIGSGRFTFSHMATHDILRYGVGGVAYSPTTENVYFTAYLGVDVWELSASGTLSHVYLGPHAFPELLAYDPSSGDMYVCGTGSSTLYLIQ